MRRSRTSSPSVRDGAVKQRKGTSAAALEPPRYEPGRGESDDRGRGLDVEAVKEVAKSHLNYAMQDSK
jgi:hypothetical protein